MIFLTYLSLYNIVFKPAISTCMMDTPKNYIEQLAEYIRSNLKKGYTLESLKISLEHQGYSKISINNAAELVHKQLSKTAPILKEKPEITYTVIEEPIIVKEQYPKEPAISTIPENFSKPDEQENFPVPARKGFFQRLFGI